MLAGVLALAAGVLIGLAAVTPWHTDADAYSAAMSALNDRLDAGERDVADFDVASRAFHGIQDRYATPKWLYADLGYSALAWAALMALAAGFRRGDARGLATRRLIPVFGIMVLALGLLFVGFLAGPLQQLGREQVPAWADSYGIVLFETVRGMAVLAPLIAIFVFMPVLLTRGPPAPLLSLRVGWGGLITGLVYLLPVAAAVALVATVAEAGGWATSTAGALLLWLFLNARAVWLGTPPPKALP